MKRPLAYITAAWCGDDDDNMERAARYCRIVYEAGFSPVCPALYLPLFLNDAVPEEHKNGIDMARDLLRRSRVLVVCGHSITEAMKNDIAVAQRLGRARAATNAPGPENGGTWRHFVPRCAGERRDIAGWRGCFQTYHSTIHKGQQADGAGAGPGAPSGGPQNCKDPPGAPDAPRQANGAPAHGPRSRHKQH